MNYSVIAFSLLEGIQERSSRLESVMLIRQSKSVFETLDSD